MKLLDEIIDLLSDEKGSLNAALLKTKVLMHRIGHAELADWVSDELNGYAPEKPVPPYRVIHGHVKGQVQSALVIHHDMNLHTGHLPEPLRRHLNVHEMRQSMAVLESLSGGTGVLRSELEPTIVMKLGEAISSGYWINKAWVDTSPNEIKNGLAQVRARLLDFALKLQDELGEAKEEEVKEAASRTDVTAMFHGAVFGDNATVVIGNQNVTHIKNVVRRNDFGSLAAALKEKGVAEADIAELKTAIAADDGTVDYENKTLGPKVKEWMTKMWGKAVEASWQIELGIAGGVLTEALKAFYFS
jgi:hypothetical protein